MTTFFIEDTINSNNEIIIQNDDFFHLKNVLRTKIGEKVYICDNLGKKYLCKLNSYEENKAKFSALEEVQIQNEPPIHITLAQGMPKKDKFEQIIKTCTELGISSFLPVNMARCVVKLEYKDFDKKITRWEKIVKEASMQSGRTKIPQILPINNFKNIIENIEKYDIVLLLYENEHFVTLKQAISKFKSKSNLNILLIVGPEGGFSEEEVSILQDKPNVYIVTIGNRILRTETAGISAASMLIYEYEL